METPDGAAIAPETGQGAATTPESGSTGSWLETIPETETFLHKEEDGSEKPLPLRDHPKLKEFKSPAELAKSLLNQEKLLGKKTLGITPLKEGATDEEKAEWNAEFRRVMAVPETPDGYEFSFPEGTKVDEGLLGWFKNASHELGLPPSMAQGVAQKWNDHVNGYWEKEFKRMDEEKAANVAALEKHFGGPEKTAEAVELAKRGFAALAGKSGIAEEEATAFAKTFGDNATFLKVFSSIGKNTSQEDSQVSGGAGGSGKNDETRDEHYAKQFPK